MPGPIVQVEGAARLRRTLKAAGEDLGELKAAHAEAAAIAAKASAALTPVRSGRLQASVRSSGTTTAGIIRAGRASVPYAGPIHWGWKRRGIKATPFLSDGATSSEGQWLPIYERTVDGALKRVEGK